MYGELAEWNLFLSLSLSFLGKGGGDGNKIYALLTSEVSMHKNVITQLYGSTTLKSLGKELP